VLRLIAVCFVLIAAALPARAQEQQPDYSSNADAYLTDIQARFPEKPDSLEARASRLDGDAAAERGAWSKAISAYERAIAFGADDFETWMGLTRALRETGETGNAIAAAFSARQVADRPTDRSKALFALGGILDHANRAREAVKAYQAGLNLEYDSQSADRIQALLDATPSASSTRASSFRGRARICLQFRDYRPSRSALRGLHQD
jgi:tetratricopeptide (TPR) repeat protein